MSYIDPKTLKIQLYLFVTSSFLPLHERILLLDVQVSLASTLRCLGLLFECSCVGHLTSRRGHPTRHRLDHGAVRPGEEGGSKGTEGWGRPRGGWIGSGLKSGCLVATGTSPMSRRTWELARWVAYIPVFTAVKAVKQSAGLWPRPRLVKMPAALISSGFQPFTQAGQVGDPNTHAQPVARPREAWIPGQRHSLANCLDADKGSVNKTSI